MTSARALPVRGLVVGALLSAVLLVATPVVARAQDEGPPSGQVPTQDIVPQPNSGEAPLEAGDRGGALQLMIPLLIVAAIGGGVWHLSREVRRGSGSGAGVSESGPRTPPGPA